jgi:SH3-like domain-containing protein
LNCSRRKLLQWRAFALSLLLAAACSGAAPAADFLAVGAAAAIQYDGPSLKANRLFIANRQYPLEIITRLGDWVKVRDAVGEIAWMQANTLTDKRTVIVTAAAADIREAPDAAAPLVFRAEKSVVLELAEPPAGSWAKVRHRDGQQGYVRVEQIWGI